MQSQAAADFQKSGVDLWSRKANSFYLTTGISGQVRKILLKRDASRATAQATPSLALPALTWAREVGRLGAELLPAWAQVGCSGAEWLLAQCRAKAVHCSVDYGLL